MISKNLFWVRQPVARMSERSTSIDTLRGFSILAVILLHINLRIPFEKSALGQWLPQPASKVIFWSGYYGVVIFFVISGFLITISSLQKWGNLQKIQCSRFYLLRFARIMPCLILLLFLLCIFDKLNFSGFVINKSQTSLTQAIFSALTFHINWLQAKVGYLPGAWDVLWSLSVEETFYVFFPLVCRLIKKEIYWVILMGLFVIVGPFARTVFSQNDIWKDHSYLSCMDGIALGCLAALLIAKVKLNSTSQKILFFAGIAFTALIIIFRKFVYNIGLTSLGLNVTLLEMGIALIIIATFKRLDNTVNEPSNSQWRLKLFCWFGRNSYEIYLFHMVLLTLLLPLYYKFNQSNETFIFAYISLLFLTGLAGGLIAKYFSNPLNKLLRERIKTLPATTIKQTIF